MIAAPQAQESAEQRAVSLLTGMNLLTEDEIDAWQAYLQSGDDAKPPGCNVLCRMAKAALFAPPTELAAAGMEQRLQAAHHDIDRLYASLNTEANARLESEKLKDKWKNISRGLEQQLRDSDAELFKCQRDVDRLREANAGLVAALELVRMSNGWRYLAVETQAMIDAALAASGR